jgi:hypothetical protein
MEPGTVHVENSTLSEKMPAMTMTVAQAGEPGEKPVVVSAVLRLDGLARIARGGGVFERYLVDDQGVLLAHPDAERVARREIAAWIPNLPALLGSRSGGGASGIFPGRRRGDRRLRPVARAGVLAGAQAPRAAAYHASRSLLRNLALVALGLLLSAAVLGVALSRRVTRNSSGSPRPRRRSGGAVRRPPGRRLARRDRDAGLVLQRDGRELSAREKALLESQAQLVRWRSSPRSGSSGRGSPTR